MRPRCSILTGGFDFSGCGDCTSCPPFEQTEMTNSEPSAIVLQGIPCMCGLYKFRFEWRNGSFKVRRAAIPASFNRRYRRSGPVAFLIENGKVTEAVRGIIGVRVV